jgi:hypothetical protein
MGLFDYIVCEVPLPDGFTGELQTKDLGCYLLTHIITKDGRLMLEHVDRSDEVLETRTTSRPTSMERSGFTEAVTERTTPGSGTNTVRSSCMGSSCPSNVICAKQTGDLGDFAISQADDGDRLLWACV